MSDNRVRDYYKITVLKPDGMKLTFRISEDSDTTDWDRFFTRMLEFIGFTNVEVNTSVTDEEGR